MRYLSVCSGIEAVPMVRWIGQRITAVNAILREQPGTGRML
jgi:hypothetical protein